MKNKNLLTYLILLVMTVQANAQTTPKINVQVREVVPMSIVYYEYTGDYKEAFGGFKELMNYVVSKGITPSNLSAGVFYDDPLQVPANELRSEVGLIIDKKIDTDGIYHFKEIAGGKAVSAKYEKMEDIMATYAALEKYIADNNLKTSEYAVEVYETLSETDFKAEILFYIE